MPGGELGLLLLGLHGLLLLGELLRRHSWRKLDWLSALASSHLLTLLRWGHSGSKPLTLLLLLWWGNSGSEPLSLLLLGGRNPWRKPLTLLLLLLGWRGWRLSHLGHRHWRCDETKRGSPGI